MSLTKEDIIRLDQLFAKYPGRSDVDRNETKITEILERAERRAKEERQRYYESLR